MEYLKNKYVQLALALILGIGVGSIFKDTKTIEKKIHREISDKHQKEISKLLSIHKSEISNLNEKIQEEQNSSKTYREETSKKIQVLTTENRSLKLKVKKRRYKLVKPDGTIIEKEYEESDTEETSSVVTEIKEEFTRKVASIEEKWKKIHKERVSKIKKTHDQKIEQLEKELFEYKSSESEETTITINENKLRTEVGIKIDREYYLHITYPIFGPIFFGLHGEKDMFGVGVGFEL